MPNICGTMDIVLKKIGVIDVGTNSVLALGIDESGAILFNDYKISEFGKGMVNNDMFLHDANIKRTFIIISQFIEKLKKLYITDIHVIGTAAAREARNASSLQMLLYNKHKTDCKVLSGDEEAKFTYLGALQGFPNQNHHFLTMDIGGGSTEITYGKKNMIIYKHSFDIGAIKLYDQLQCNYQFTKDDFQKTMSTVIMKIDGIPKLTGGTKFVGIGGTFTTATAVKFALAQYDMDVVNNGILTLNELTEIMNKINSANEIERRKIPGLEIKRAPYIIYGMLIYITLMKRLGIERVHTTDFGLRFGYADYILKKN